MMFSKGLVMHKERRRFLREVNAKELDALAKSLASPEFTIGLRRFGNKQLAKKQGSSKLSICIVDSRMRRTAVR